MDAASGGRDEVRWIAGDLAPGDHKSKGLDVALLTVSSIAAETDQDFAEAYGLLWEEFGLRGEMEGEEVIASRLQWRSTPSKDGWTRYYQLLLVRDGERWAAVRDHSVIIPPDDAGGEPAAAIVHLSHLLIAERWRRTGLAGWMRALPLQTVRRCLRSRSQPVDQVAVTLVAEMDPVLLGAPERAGRMLAYGKAGFRLVDPAAIHYFQPDFRPGRVIDATGGPQPLPMELMVRRVGREGEHTVEGAEVHRLVGGLYRLYAENGHLRNVASLRDQTMSDGPAPGQRVSLLDPGAFLGR